MNKFGSFKKKLTGRLTKSQAIVLVLIITLLLSFPSATFAKKVYSSTLNQLPVTPPVKPSLPTPPKRPVTPPVRPIPPKSPVTPPIPFPFKTPSPFQR
ncbi:hypothetical protein A2865_01570 [Candidatus Woesebacteria bacterium RIFCSPHIGHO2_01_FULL_39_17]|uniref:Uncharacterized protein n=1 Tax=Candidatus Woesebacteria bacterium RIFCSPLOWO2_01_FULL_39_14 TaxID=1802518 RepID=A0A1F8BED3_9BACT|nr:MAG: hypothetical protein A2865_01570 [Candidatus Woesebacteria bacterium RIFCSPHIGHO2_01_FULL_39_17]OGM62009.1 MAG: hypothetical protein A3A52_02000 [Candidatus Woesebacteria bacterium RIFCSPLOWO2_01_FULL_39_14]